MAKKTAALHAYQEKRNFLATTEPSSKNRSGSRKITKAPIFVVQKHAASHLHYDFRLEDHGLLLSWAIPKGIPKKIGIKRLAVQTEDHPLEYAHFEGMIPPGNYGAGSVEIWDHGTFTNITKDKNGKIIPIAICLKKGRLKIKLAGNKLQGIYVLIRTKLKNKTDWLLFKMDPKNIADKNTHKLKISNRVVSITHPDKLMFPKDLITKQEIIDYYHLIAPVMIPYTKDRFVTMFRAPEGINGEKFYQKNVPESYPRWIKSVPIPLKGNGVDRMIVINNSATLVYLANQGCITPHVSLSRIDKLDYPDRMIFDLDPSPKNSFSEICQAALKLKELLDQKGLISFVMTTGSRGLHVVVPIKRYANFDMVREKAQKVAAELTTQHPKELTTEIRKNRRRGCIYIDTSRNAYGQTSVAPYAIRALPGAPVATPLFWEELTGKKLTAQTYTIKNVQKKLAMYGNPWDNIGRYARSIKKI